MLLYVRGITLLNTMLSIGVFLGFTLTIFLLFQRSHKNFANLLLAMIVLCYTIFILPGYLYGAHLLQYVPHLSNIGGFIFPILGPLIYFYTKANTQRAFRFRPVDALHLFPFLILLILDWKFFNISGDLKYQQYEAFTESGNYPFPLWERIAKVVLAFVYFVWSARLVLLYKRHLSETSTYSNKTYYWWLLVFSSALLVPTVVLTIVAFTQYQLISVTIFAFSFILFIMMVYAAALLKPSLFHRFPNKMEAISAEQVAQKKYESSNLRDEQKEVMVEKLLNYVSTEHPYLEPELTLGQLADQVEIPSHYLSQVINEKIKKSFGDFINSYRIEKAKAMLADDQFSHYTIIATAYEAGFNSKTAFYEAFKKFTGSTPSKYRKSL